MLKRQWDAENNRKLFIPSENATLVAELPVVDPPLGKTAVLVPVFTLKDLPLNRTL